MERIFFVLGAVFALIGVGAGAFGAHALRGLSRPTCCRLRHRRALPADPRARAAGGCLGRRTLAAAGAAAAGCCFVAGTVLFTGSLYALALTGERGARCDHALRWRCLPAGLDAAGVEARRRVGSAERRSVESRRVPSQRRRFFSLGLALAVAGSVLFSAKAIVVKLAYRYHVDPLTLIALRMAFAAPFFAVSYWWSIARRRADSPARDHGRLITLGVLGYYPASYLDFLGLQHVTAALERLILFLNPTIVLLLSAFFLGQADPPARVDRAGAVVRRHRARLLLHDARLEGGRIALGSLLVFGSALCYAPIS